MLALVFAPFLVLRQGRFHCEMRGPVLALVFASLRLCVLFVAADRKVSTSFQYSFGLLDSRD